MAYKHPWIYLFLAFLVMTTNVIAQRQMENLGRGLVAIRYGKDSVFIGWRMLGTDPENIAFNIYRRSGRNKPVKLNTNPITEETNFIDTNADFSQANAYLLRPLLMLKRGVQALPFILIELNFRLRFILTNLR